MIIVIRFFFIALWQTPSFCIKRKARDTILGQWIRHQSITQCIKNQMICKLHCRISSLHSYFIYQSTFFVQYFHRFRFHQIKQGIQCIKSHIQSSGYISLINWFPLNMIIYQPIRRFSACYRSFHFIKANVIIVFPQLPFTSLFTVLWHFYILYIYGCHVSQIFRSMAEQRSYMRRTT